MADQPVIGPRERQTLAALRYAVQEEAGAYLAIMRLFTSGMAAFLSDQSAAEIADLLTAQGMDLDHDTVEARLVYLVEHGNLARSPRETEARSIKEYLSNRARYQLTQRGELVHRQVEELLEHTDAAREVSSEMLPGILAGLESLLHTAQDGDLETVDPSDLAARITTVFAQFELLVSSTRQFYTYLSQVLTRFDLGRDEFQTFKGVLLDYLQRFVDEVSRHMPQLADVLRQLAPQVPGLTDRAGAGQRLIDVDGRAARRAPGLSPEDWQGIQVWFVGAAGRAPDADNVRRLATDAMRALLVNLRRITAGADRQQSRYDDLLRLARWFDESSHDQAHELWAAAFGLYSARHLGFTADDDSDPVPATATWWRTEVAEVPVSLRKLGERRAAGRAGARVDYSAAKEARLAERRRAHEQRMAALREIGQHTGDLEQVHLSDGARKELLELYSQTLSSYGRPLTKDAQALAETAVDNQRLRLIITQDPRRSTVITSPQGALTMDGVRLHLTWADTSATDLSLASGSELRADRGPR
ncbi:TIGR02677 family protein [Leekyejoonella antrihumi]|nr:TIGR02677 family protein [Leekyejoonella antrihumi]